MGLKNVVLGSMALYLKEVGQADKAIIEFTYDDANNRIAMAMKSIAGDTFLSMTETAGDPTFAGDFVTYIQDLISTYTAALDWQESVLTYYDPTPNLPVGPADGARYLALATANGWTAGRIYQWSAAGAAYTVTMPEEGMTVFVDDENQFYRYANSAWLKFFNVTDLQAAMIGVADATGWYTATTVEAALTEVVTKLRAQDWQKSVISEWAPSGGLPIGPANGDRYLATDAGNGWFATNLYEWNTVAAAWLELVSAEGMTVFNKATGVFKVYHAANWVALPEAAAHIADPTAAHAASAISYTDTNGIGATDLQDAVDTVGAAEIAVENQGYIGEAFWTPANNPTALDEIDIGGDTYIFQTAISETNTPTAANIGDIHLIGSAPTGAWVGKENQLAEVTTADPPGPAAWTYTAPGAGEIFVHIKGSTALTLAALSVKVNANGTENVVSVDMTTMLRIREADAPGGTAVAGVLPAVSATEVADVWLESATGKVSGGQHFEAAIALTTETVAAAFDIVIPFVIGANNFFFQIHSSGAIKPTTCTMVHNPGTGLTYDPTAGITHPVNGDVLVVRAWA